VRVAVSGSHGTGKSTLIAAFLERRPEYAHEPEAYEALADDVALTAEGPTPEGLESLLHYTVSALADHPPGARVIFERSPVDYLAYAAASRREWSRELRRAFLRAQIPAVRAAVRHLDVIVLLPVSDRGPILPRPGEDERFRRRVDDHLRRALIDDEYDLFGDGRSPLVRELSPVPSRQLVELDRLTTD
jgi:hypothetical protein